MAPSSQPPPAQAVMTRAGMPAWVAAALIALATFVAYRNTFTAPFVFDDERAVVENQTIRQWSTALFPPDDNGSGVRGRPLINLSLALNYAVGGLDVRGYHALNLLLHLAAALTLYGIARRTLRRPRLVARFGEAAERLALAIAMIWAVHPLLTESVTCVVQRTESLAGLWYLLTLYGFVRATEPGGSKRWLVGSVAACLLGVTAKEILATAPLVVLLYDCTFVSGSPGAAWRQRRGYYLALWAAWLPLAALVLGAEGRGGTVGFGAGVLWWQYALRQSEAVVAYLGLSAWPHPLVLDYGVDVVERVGAVWPQLVLLAGAGVAMLWALWRRRPAGFLGACFFAILAPSSSVVPLATQTMAEHRMYLPLAALVAGAVAAGYAALGRRIVLLLALGAVALAAGTMARNETYRTGLSIWSDTVRHRPGNARAHCDLAVELLELDRLPEAERELRAALQLAPDYADALANLGKLLVLSGRPAEAVPLLERVLAVRPDYFLAQRSLGAGLDKLGRPADAIAPYAAAARLQPDSALAHFDLGNALVELRRLPEAVGPLETAVRLRPQSASMRAVLAGTLAALGRTAEATAAFETALRLDPNVPDAHFNFGVLCFKLGDFAGAEQQWKRTLELNPDYAEARANLERLRESEVSRNPTGGKP